MTVIEKSIQVPYSTDQMFELVAAVQNYPQFVKACVKGEIISGGEDEVVARLSFAKSGLSHTFTTRNTLTRTSQIHMELVDGPFRYLHGDWLFKTVKGGCEVTITVDYEFSNMMLKMMLQSMMQQLIYELVESFCEQADVLYG